MYSSCVVALTDVVARIVREFGTFTVRHNLLMLGNIEESRNGYSYGLPQLVRLWPTIPLELVHFVKLSHRAGWSEARSCSAVRCYILFCSPMLAKAATAELLRA